MSHAYFSTCAMWRAPRKGGGGGIGSESRQLFVCAAGMLAAPIRLQNFSVMCYSCAELSPVCFVSSEYRLFQSSAWRHRTLRKIFARQFRVPYSSLGTGSFAPTKNWL